MSRSRIALSVVALVLLVGACGGDDDDGSKATTTTAAEDGSTTTRPGPVPPLDPSEEPDEVVTEMNLIGADFTGEWPEEPADEAVGRDLDGCFTELDEDDVVASADGPSITPPTDETDQVISTRTLVLADEDAAEALVDAAADEAFGGCAGEVMVAGFEVDGTTADTLELATVEAPGSAPSTTTSTEVSPGSTQPVPGLSVDQRHDLQGGVTLTRSGGEAAEGRASLVLLRSGAVVTEILVLGVEGEDFLFMVEDTANSVALKHDRLP